jgi:hypothetical protein
VLTDTNSKPHQRNQCVSGIFGGCIGARMKWLACTVHLASCNARKPNTWTLFAPNRSIAIPHMSWGAHESLARLYDGRSSESR